MWKYLFIAKMLEKHDIFDIRLYIGYVTNIYLFFNKDANPAGADQATERPFTKKGDGHDEWRE